MQTTHAIRTVSGIAKNVSLDFDNVKVWFCWR